MGIALLVESSIKSPPIWPGSVELWHLARRHAGVADDTINVWPTSDWMLASWLADYKRQLFFRKSIAINGGWYMLPKHHPCTATVRGGWTDGRENVVQLIYLRVYKGGNNEVCANLARLHDASLPPANRTFAFTFVREPLSHFESGYAELTYRARKKPQYTDHPQLYTFFRSPSSCVPCERAGRRSTTSATWIASAPRGRASCE